MALEAIVSPFLKTLRNLGLGMPEGSETTECSWLQCLSLMTDDVPLIPDDPRGPGVGKDDTSEGPIWLSDNFYVKSLAIFNQPQDLLTRKQALALTTYLVQEDIRHRAAEKSNPKVRKTWWFVMLDNWYVTTIRYR